MCRAWILLPRESLSQNAIVVCVCFFSLSSLIMLRHCQAKRMVCAFASKQFEYVVRLNIEPSGTNKKKKMFGIFVWCLLSPPDWKRYRRQKQSPNKWLGTTKSVLTLFAFYCVLFVRAQSSHQRQRQRRRWRRQINRKCTRKKFHEGKKQKKPFGWLCVTSSTHFSHIYLLRQEQFDNTLGFNSID